MYPITHTPLFYLTLIMVINVIFYIGCIIVGTQVIRRVKRMEDQSNEINQLLINELKNLVKSINILK